MKNVTITLADDLAAWARVAAKQGRSLSRYVAQLLAERRAGQARQRVLSSQREALERFLAGPDLPLSEGGRLPTRGERYTEREGPASSINVMERKQ
jgi:hypothetical protein